MGEVSTQFSDTARKKLSALNVYSLNPTELGRPEFLILSTQGGMVPMYVDDSFVEMEHVFRGFIERE